MGFETDSLIAPEVEKKTENVEPPPLYRVLLLNDDFTPMEFVIQVLVRFFAKNEVDATNIMWKVHFEGKAICGIYPYDIATTKVQCVKEFAKEHDHPLACEMEENI